MVKQFPHVFAALSAIVFLLPNGSSAAGPKENAETLDRWLESMVSRGFRGQVLLARDGTIALNRAYGVADEASEAPATNDTLYYVGSVAKMFTSAVVFQLENEGKLKLADRIGEHLADVPPEKTKIRIRHLLSHTSGAVANHPDPLSKLDRESFLAWFMATPLEHAPGKQHHYSNVGYSVLAAIIEQVDGVSFQTSLRRRIFEPAGMLNTYFLDEIEPHIERLAVGSGEKVIEYGVDGKPASYGGTWLRLGPGGIVSTATDLFRWERAIGEAKVISPKDYRIATKPYKPDQPWGLGWRLSKTTRGTPLHYHDGGFPGFNSLFARYPEEDAVIIVLCNRDDAAGMVGQRLSKDFLQE